MPIIADVTVTIPTETIWMWIGIAYGVIQTAMYFKFKEKNK
jgi:hypothetical protein